VVGPDPASSSSRAVTTGLMTWWRHFMGVQLPSSGHRRASSSSLRPQGLAVCVARKGPGIAPPAEAMPFSSDFQDPTC